MAINDPLSNVLSHILNCEKSGKKECIVKPISSLIKRVLHIMKENKYIGDFKEYPGRGGYIKINLLGRVNKCGVIKPRFSVKKINRKNMKRDTCPLKILGL